MNFQYLEDLDFEFMNSICDLKVTLISLNENNTEKSSRNEENAKEMETSSKGLTLKELPRHLKYVFLEPEKVKLVIISSALTVFEEQKLLEILKKYKEAIAWLVEDLK